MPRVLIVEDNRWLSDSYARLLERQGYAVSCVADADKAIDVIDEQHPDVILLDMLLTKTTAIALLHELQSHIDLAAISIVIISSMADRLHLHDLKMYGVRDILDKETVTPSTMAQTIKEALYENVSH